MVEPHPAFSAAPTAAADGPSLREALAARGHAFRSIRGDSMVPTLVDGEIVRVVPVRRLRRGQVLVFEDEKGLVVVHRVRKLTGASVVCQGDNRRTRDAAVRREAVIGKVTEILGHGTVADAGLDLAVAEARLILRRSVRPAARLRRLRREGALLLAQIVADPEWSGPLADHGVPADLQLSGPGRPKEDGRPAVVASPLHVAVDGRPSEAARSADSLVVPAGVYCRLSPAARRRLLTSLAGRSIEVFAYPRVSAGLLLRSLAWLRSAAARVGFDWGDPGDAVSDGPEAALVHLYDTDELRSELASFLPGRSVRAGSASGPTDLLQAVVTRTVEGAAGATAL